MLEEGTASRTAEQIAVEAESMGANVSSTCGWGGAYVSFKCLSDDYPRLVELAADILRNPTFPESEWNRVRGQASAALRAERDHAESRGHRALLAALYPETDPYRFPLAGTEASVEGIARTDLAAFHTRLLASSEPTIIVAGDVDPDALAAELERRLLPWPELGAKAQRSARVFALKRDAPALARSPGRCPGRGAGRLRRHRRARALTSTMSWS